MNINTDIFKIQSNNVMPSRGKILISEPFLHDVTFGRSVVLLVDHTEEGSMELQYMIFGKSNKDQNEKKS